MQHIDQSPHHVSEKNGRERTTDSIHHSSCVHPDCPHRRRLQLILYDVIEQLEQTRRTFKSKQIELLRKKLIKVLLEDS